MTRRLALTRSFAGFRPSHDSQIRGNLFRYRPIKYASIHIQTLACTSSYPSAFSLSRFARVVSINRLPAVRDQPTKETIGRPTVYTARRFQIVSGSSCISLPLPFLIVLLLSLNTKDRGFPLRLYIYILRLVHRLSDDPYELFLSAGLFYNRVSIWKRKIKNYYY